ncbi:MAG: helix-turn-helix domain-containing protein [archaeon]
MKEILEKIGLTPTESKVYLALLDLGEAKSGDILKKAGLNSGRIYEVLDSLKRKGLVSYIVKNKVKLFVPSPPDRITDYVTENINSLLEKRKEFNQELPKLKQRYNQVKEKTFVEIFFGVQGQRTAYSLLFKEADKDKNLFVYSIVERKKYSKELQNLLEFYVYKKRKELKLKTLKIAAEEARKDKFYSQDNSKIKYLPHPSMTSIQTLGDVTLITIEKDPIITILIKNKEMTNDFKEQFNLLWKIAKK